MLSFIGTIFAFLFSWILAILYYAFKLILYLIVLVFFVLWKHQGAILYQRHAPHRKRQIAYNPMQRVRTPSYYKFDYHDFFVLTKDKVNIHCWLIRQTNSASCPTIVTFHGNAGNIGYRLPNTYFMYRELKCNILMVDYRGYGNSEGCPTEMGLVYDAESILQHLSTRTDIDPHQIILFGRSLGGAIAIDLAWRCCTNQLKTLDPDMVSVTNGTNHSNTSNESDQSTSAVSSSSVSEEDCDELTQLNHHHSNHSHNNNHNKTGNSGENMKANKSGNSSVVANSSANNNNSNSNHDRNDNGINATTTHNKITVIGLVVENTFTSILDMVFVIIYGFLGLNASDFEDTHADDTHKHGHIAANVNAQPTDSTGDHTGVENNGRSIFEAVDSNDGTANPQSTNSGGSGVNGNGNGNGNAVDMQSVNGNANADTSYLSVRVIRNILRGLRVFLRYFITNQWNSIDKIRAITMPILLLSGQKDELVPPIQMKRLFAATSPSVLSVMQMYSSGDHNSTWQKGGQKYWDDVFAFLTSVIFMSKVQLS